LITIAGGGKSYTTRTLTDGTYIIKGMALGAYSVKISFSNAAFNLDTQSVTLNGDNPAATNIDFTPGNPVS
jgi:hypothetical protein